MSTRGYCGVTINEVGDGKVITNSADKWEIMDHSLASEGFDILLERAEEKPVYMLWYSFPLVTGEAR